MKFSKRVGCKVFFCLMLAISSHVCFAQQAGLFILKAGKLFDSEAGEFKTGMVVYVKNGRIEEVKQEKDVTAYDKKNYLWIDLSRCTVLPGLIDAHTHLLSRELIYPNAPPPSTDPVKTVTLEGDAYRTLYGAAKAKGYLEHGITTVQDLGNSGQFADIALRTAINEELVPGPRMRCSGMGLSSEGGQFPGLRYPYRSIAEKEYRIVKGADDAIQAVRENIAQGADVIKIYSDNAPNNTMLSIDEMKSIVTEAKRYGLRVTAHAVNNTSVWNAVMAGVDAIEHGYRVDDSTFQLMKLCNVALIPTDGDSLGYAKFAEQKWPNDTAQLRRFIGFTKGRTERLKRAIKAGVTIVHGSDDYTDIRLPFGEMPLRNLIGYSLAGLSIPEVLKTATINAANHLRWGNRIGIIKKGYWADIIAIEGDLERDIYKLLNTQFVMKEGKVAINKIK
jgi:imidazolonepropionase-like amidohydrolase